MYQNAADQRVERHEMIDDNIMVELSECKKCELKLEKNEREVGNEFFLR